MLSAHEEDPARRPRRAGLPGAAGRAAGLQASRRQPGSARVVPGRAPRYVRSLGRLQPARRRRVGHEQQEDSHRRLRKAAGDVQSDRLQRRRMGVAREIRRDEVHHHHEQAPRRLRNVRLEGVGLQRRRAHAVQEGCPEGARRGVPPPGPQAVLLLLAARLAPPRLLSARTDRPGRGPARARRLPAVSRLHGRPTARVADKLRGHRRHLVRRRLGPARRRLADAIVPTR